VVHAILNVLDQHVRGQGHWSLSVRYVFGSASELQVASIVVVLLGANNFTCMHL